MGPVSRAFWWFYGLFYDAIWDSVVSDRLADAIASRLTRGGEVLDFGCGSGLIAGRLVRHGHRIVAVDPSATLLRKARSRQVAAEYLLSSRVPAARRFESAIVVNVLHLVTRPAPLLDRLLAATDGVVVAVWPEDEVSVGDLLRWEREGGESRSRVIRAALLRVLVGVPGLLLGIRRTPAEALSSAADAVAARHSRELAIAKIPGTGCVMTAFLPASGDAGRRETQARLDAPVRGAR